MVLIRTKKKQRLASESKVLTIRNGEGVCVGGFVGVYSGGANYKENV